MQTRQELIHMKYSALHPNNLSNFLDIEQKIDRVNKDVDGVEWTNISKETLNIQLVKILTLDQAEQFEEHTLRTVMLPALPLF